MFQSHVGVDGGLLVSLSPRGLGFIGNKAMENAK